MTPNFNHGHRLFTYINADKVLEFLSFLKLQSGLDGVPRSIFIAHNANVVINDES